MTCEYCGKPGHNIGNCFTKQRNERPRTPPAQGSGSGGGGGGGGSHGGGGGGYNNRSVQQSRDRRQGDATRSASVSQVDSLALDIDRAATHAVLKVDVADVTDSAWVVHRSDSGALEATADVSGPTGASSRQVAVCVDTGASTSLVDASLLDEIGVGIGKPTTKVTIRAANGGHMPHHGTATITLTAPSAEPRDVPALVTTLGGPHRVILGVTSRPPEQARSQTVYSRDTQARTRARAQTGNG